MANGYETRLKRVIDHIYDHPGGDLSLDQLADVAAMSRFHWHRVFRAMTGETCAQAVKRIRMHLASIALVQSQRPVPQIAAELGYRNAASFARAFADIYRASPAAFRSAGRAPPPPTFTQPGDPTMHPVEIRDLPARRIAALAHKGPYPDIGRSFQKLYASIAAAGLFGRIAHSVALYYDDPYAMASDELHSHAGVTLLEGAEAPPGLEALEIAAGRAAVLTFRGAYAGLAVAWDQLYSGWLPGSGAEAGDAAPYEVYLNDPTDTAPEDLITEIVLPLRPL